MNKFKYKPWMKKHQVLKEAMKYLSDTNSVHTKNSNKYEFICYTIGAVVNPNNPYNYTHALQKDIDDRLGGWPTFNDWLLDTHNISYEDQDNNKGRKLQYTRLCWMQSMYEEFLVKDE